MGKNQNNMKAADCTNLNGGEFQTQIAGFIWSIADQLRGPYKPNQFRDVMLPLVVLRRLDCVLAPTKEKVLKKYKELSGKKIKNIDPILNDITGRQFHNRSPFTFETLKNDPDNLAVNLVSYMRGFSACAADIIQHFDFEKQIQKLEESNLLYYIMGRFCEVDLHPDRVSSIEMGYVFEELIRRFNEACNEEAGDHFTPREVIMLMSQMLFEPDLKSLKANKLVRTLYDPACGTGGMLAVSEGFLRVINPDMRLEIFGQDVNGGAYAICGSDMMIKGHNMKNIFHGCTFTEDNYKGRKFDYMLANPPFGVDWKKQSAFIDKEHEEQGYDGRFGAGLPRTSDGALLFLQHMISKMNPVSEGGTRLAIVFNGSPLFTGGAGSGESEIRRWIIENDWLEAIVALPTELFYNTGISTYFWIVTNRKEKKRRGKVQLIDGTGFFKKMKKSLGNKRKEICPDQRNDILRLYRNFEENELSRIFGNEDFGYRRVTIEQPLRMNFAVTPDRLTNLDGINNLPKALKGALRELAPLGTMKDRRIFSSRLGTLLKKEQIKLTAGQTKAVMNALSERDETAEICRDNDGNPEPDTELRDYENVPLKQDLRAYFDREVSPHVPDAWINNDVRDEKDGEIGKIGCEININRYFYKYVSPRSLDEIEADIRAMEKDIVEALREVAG